MVIRESNGNRRLDNRAHSYELYSDMREEAGHLLSMQISPAFCRWIKQPRHRPLNSIEIAS